MTITRFETGKSGGQGSTLRKLEAAIAAAGLELTNGDAPGVRMRPAD